MHITIDIKRIFLFRTACTIFTFPVKKHSRIWLIGNFTLPTRNRITNPVGRITLIIIMHHSTYRHRVMRLPFCFFLLQLYNLHFILCILNHDRCHHLCIGRTDIGKIRGLPAGLQLPGENRNRNCS